MLYAKFAYPENGWDIDVELAKKAELKVGEKYKVKWVNMGQSHTYIGLEGYSFLFNSVQFEFEENGVEINIYKDPRYNPYL